MMKFQQTLIGPNLSRVKPRNSCGADSIQEPPNVKLSPQEQELNLQVKFKFHDQGYVSGYMVVKSVWGNSGF